MTNAIEQAKREMYNELSRVRSVIRDGRRDVYVEFESSMEKYLELLRQDHEALHETARGRWENLEKLWVENGELTQRLAKMTEERDSIQLRLHAIDHAYREQQSKGATMHQDSGDRASCATPDAKTMVILGSVLDVQRFVSDWALGDTKAKHAIRKIAAVVNGDLDVAKALDAFENPGKYAEMIIHAQYDDGIRSYPSLKEVKKCQHSFFAIGEGEMKCTFCGAGKPVCEYCGGDGYVHCNGGRPTAPCPNGCQ